MHPEGAGDLGVALLGHLRQPVIGDLADERRCASVLDQGGRLHAHAVDRGRRRDAGWAGRADSHQHRSERLRVEIGRDGQEAVVVERGDHELEGGAEAGRQVRGCVAEQVCPPVRSGTGSASQWAVAQAAHRSAAVASPHVGQARHGTRSSSGLSSTARSIAASSSTALAGRSARKDRSRSPGRASSRGVKPIEGLDRSTPAR